MVNVYNTHANGSWGVGRTFSVLKAVTTYASDTTAIECINVAVLLTVVFYASHDCNAVIKQKRTWRNCWQWLMSLFRQTVLNRWLCSFAAADFLSLKTWHAFQPCCFIISATPVMCEMLNLLYVCPFGMHLLQNCWMNLADILHREGDLSRALHLAFQWCLPQKCDFLMSIAVNSASLSQPLFWKRFIW